MTVNKVLALLGEKNISMNIQASVKRLELCATPQPIPVLFWLSNVRPPSPDNRCLRSFISGGQRQSQLVIILFQKPWGTPSCEQHFTNTGVNTGEGVYMFGKGRVGGWWAVPCFSYWWH